jgi:hypothetical protein
VVQGTGWELQPALAEWLMSSLQEELSQASPKPGAPHLESERVDSDDL